MMVFWRLVAFILCLSVGHAWAFDSSTYRQNTYGGLPTKYCDPTKSLADNTGGGTSESDTYNLTQCQANASPGDVIGILPGVGVTLTSTNNDNFPTFTPATGGTNTTVRSGRIVFVTKYAATALSSVATNPNRTELRHDGTAPSIVGGVGAGTGSAMYGVNAKNYVTFDGFFVDVTHAYPKEDSGIVRAEDATGTHFRNFEIKGTNITMASNAVLYRTNNVIDTIVSNFRIYDWHNDPTGSATPQGGAWCDLYGDRNYLIEYFDVSNTDSGFFAKGTAPSNVNYNYGTIQYGIIRNMTNYNGSSWGMRFNDFDNSNTTTVHHVLIYGIEGSGIALSSETTDPRNLLLHHVTVAKGSSTNANGHGPVYIKDAASMSSVTLRDNIFDHDSGTYGSMVDAGELVGAVMPTMNYNGYTKNGSTTTWSFNGGSSTTMANWRTASSQEANSQVLTTPIFTDRTNNDYTIAAAHAALTASSTGGEIGAYEGSINPGVDSTAGSGTAVISGNGTFIGSVRIQ